MTKLRVESFTISIDGFGAGPDQSLENPLGVGGPESWVWGLGSWVWGSHRPPCLWFIGSGILKTEKREICNLEI